MKHLDLFSGIGGFSLAASRAWPDHEVVAFCEIDKFCQKVLKKHWPGVPIYDDIKTLKGSDFGRVDILTGGFPCQPYSQAGKQRGEDDYRALWPEMFRIIKESKPRWVVGENVVEFINMGLDQALSDLESGGYEVLPPFIIPACGVGADHKRERVWIVANSKGQLEGHGHAHDVSALWNRKEEGEACCTVQSSIPWDAEPGLDRVADGIPNRVDRLRGIGNAIVPQVAEQIFKAIKQADMDK